MSDSIVIVGASRTPMGAFQGELASLDASDLGGVAIAGALKGAGIDAADINEVLMGCCLPAGQGQAPARQAAFKAGLPKEVPATTLNKMCGSGMKTTMVAFDQLLAGNGDIVVAGGMESMSNAPYLLPKMRSGARLGHGEVIDHMFLDGLEDAYDKGRLMGTFAEDCAEKYQLTREAQDEFALRSLANANKAREDGSFDNEISPLTIKTRKGETTITSDESPRKAMPEKIPNLRPAFKKDGTVTAANASSISDGAAALILMRESDAKAKGLNIRARILGHASHAQEPNWFTTAPVPAINKLLKRIGWNKDDIDLWEINEAFAVVPMAAQAEIGIDRDKINVHGGACAVGHPIGASGARIIVTLLNALESHGLKKGMAGICIGGGEGTAIAIELV
ncbi:MAG: acetyl-CoA C-acyltransferase [Rhizobiaceae bacterium]|nr:acetyl-CoA C-acyltransferase [Rhizobiaceae bacterium]